MAEYIVLLGHSLPEGIVDEVEALLLIHFPENQFRFGVTPEHAQGFSVLPITGHEAQAGRDYDGIVLLIQETLDAHSRAGAESHRQVRRAFGVADHGTRGAGCSWTTCRFVGQGRAPSVEAALLQRIHDV